MDQWKLNLWRRMASCRTLQTGHSLMSSIISKLQDLMSRLLLSRTRKSMASLCS